MLHASQIDQAVLGYYNIKRLKAVGYADTRVTSLTTVDSLIADLEAFKALPGTHSDATPIIDAAINSIRWAAANDLLDTTIVTALTSVATDSVTTTADLSYVFYGVTGFPTGTTPRSANDLTMMQPA